MLRRWADAIGIEAGAVSTEYGVLLSLIAIVIIAAVTAFGLAVADLFLRGNRF
jgi:Flp pilus assembly pilin Flp